MKKLKKFTFSERTRRIITYLMYLAFTIYTLHKLIQEPSLAGRICYVLLLGIILGIACWAEYLRLLYTRMIYALTIECDPGKARHFYHTLMKKDFFKSYKQTLFIFDTLYYQDLHKPDTCIEILEAHDHMFRSSLDYLLIRNYTYFYSYYKLGNRTKVKAYYPEVMKMKGAKIKGSKVKPLYNWDYIEAIYLYMMKDYKKSLKAFCNVNLKNFNNRELAQYYHDYGKLYLQLQDKVNAVIMFKKAVEVGKQLTYAKEAKTYLKKM